MFKVNELRKGKLCIKIIISSTAHLTATATNHLGLTATIDMTFSGYQTDADYVGPKKFGGRTIDTSDWTYY